jgi:hypothetical protein
MCRTIESGTSDQAPRERQRARRYGRTGGEGGAARDGSDGEFT